MEKQCVVTFFHLYSHSDRGNLQCFILLSGNKKQHFHRAVKQCRNPFQAARIKSREMCGMSAKVSGIYLADSVKWQCPTWLSYGSSRRRIKVFVLWRESLQTCLWGALLFSSFYRKGLNSWRQTEPLLYLTGYHKHSCMLHAYCKCVQLGGRVCKHKDTTLQHMPKQV